MQSIILIIQVLKLIDYYKGNDLNYLYKMKLFGNGAIKYLVTTENYFIILLQQKQKIITKLNIYYIKTVKQNGNNI